MCGIVGIYAKSNISEDVIAGMTTLLRHRGPDAFATFISDSGNLALGHTRLSVIDLSQQANQPMHSADKRFTIILNGEIYNFATIRHEIEKTNPELLFRTHSDTEVVLHAFMTWGADMVNRLEGMFAIAIYDSLIQKLFLFRDRIGKKPLYYFSDSQYFVFASEIKAMLKHPVVSTRKEINQQSIHQFLHLGYIPEPNTIFQAIVKFPAGHWAEVDSNLLIDIHPYWRINDQIGEAAEKDPTASQQTLRDNLHQAVKKRLISDVPVGCFLSGGTDSSLVTSIAATYTDQPLKTFSIGFKEQAFDEHHYAAKVASHLKTDHHEYILAEREAAEILETCLQHFDEPFADTSAIPTMLVSKLARKEVVVALTGDGGDELFLGYGSYAWAQRLSNPFFQAIQSPLAYCLHKLGNDRLRRISELLEKVEKSKLRSHIFSQEQYFFSDKELREELLVNRESYSSFRYEDPPPVGRFLSEADKQAIFDLQFYLKDDLLVKVDRASMFYALECRCPLLDTKVVEQSLRLPDNLKRRGNVSKWILKELLKEYLPDDLIFRPKWGFSIPLARWLKNEFHYLLDNYLNAEIIEEFGVVKSDYVDQIKAAFMRGEDHLYNRIWLLIVIHKWLKENG